MNKIRKSLSMSATQVERPEKSSLSLRGSFAFLLVLLFGVGSYWLLSRPFWNSPVVMTAKVQSIQPSLISEESEITAPIFYFIINLPKKFLKKPVPYQISYKKGPPTHFISQVEGHLNPEIQLSFEGPKTPEGNLDRNAIRKCFTSDFNWDCLNSRQLTLKRLTQSNSTHEPTEWDLKWFQINDSTLSNDEQTQGLYVQAKQETAITDYWIVINNNGAQQWVTLQRPNTPTGQKAFELVSQSISSIRVYPDLKFGRDFVDRSLAEVRLEKIKSESNSELRMSRLIETQILLIAKLSIEPGSLESFFHLAGTSTLLMQNPDPAQFFWSSMAQGNLKASYLYARDIAPLDPKTSQIQAFWLHTGNSGS